MSFLNRERDKRDADHIQMVFLECMKGAIEAGEAVFGLDPTEVAAIAGVVLGEYCGCNDDTMMHNPEYVSRMDEACKRTGRPLTQTPCLETAKANMAFGHEDHTAIHKKIRVGKEAGEQMLKDVCESHKGRK